MPGFMEYLNDPIDLFGKRRATQAQEAATKLGNQALGYAEDWSNELSSHYQPSINKGLESLQRTQSMTDQLLSGGVPQYQNFSNQGLQDLYANYMNQSQLPSYMQTNMPAPVDYDNMQQSDLYSQLMSSSQDALGDYLPQGMSEDIASAINANDYQLADRIYNDDLANYDLALENNAYRNQMLDQRLNQGVGMEQLLSQFGQSNYQNQLENYGAERQQLQDYLNQLNTITGWGQTASDLYGRLGTQILGVQTDTLSGMANNELSNAGSQIANRAGLFNSIAQGAGGLFKSSGNNNQNITQTSTDSKG